MGVAPAWNVASTARTAVDVFLEQLGCSRNRVLLLDYDGTIAPFTVPRNRAFPYATVPEYLDCIMSTCRTRVVLVTGRSAKEVPPLLGLNPHPEVWGAHGMEYLRPDGHCEVVDLSEAASQELVRAELALEQCGLEALTEAKPGAVAVHWRGVAAPHLEHIRAKAYEIFSRFLHSTGLKLAEFDGGLELRVRTPHKGDVVRAIASEYARTDPIAYLGDDTTDEDAFRALNGHGLTVLVHSTYRFTAAQVWLQPPHELVQFLADWVRACGGDM